METGEEVVASYETLHEYSIKWENSIHTIWENTAIIIVTVDDDNISISDSPSLFHYSISRLKHYCLER